MTPDAGTYDLKVLRTRVIQENGRAVDDSISELADAHPDQCALALALLDTDGDDLDLIGIEPTGEAFHAIKLESGTGRPPNPMVNAGALSYVPDSGVARLLGSS